MQTVVAQHVHVVSAGAAIPFQLVQDPIDPTLIHVEPPARGVWARGVPVEVTVDATLPDVFGSPLGVATTTSFVPCDLDATGKGCLSAADAGATADAGTTADAGVATDAPLDASPLSDAPTDADADAPTDADAAID